MGQQQSRDELLHQQAVEGNVDNIKALCREGAGLEWMDKDGKTTLIVASMDPRLYLVAKTLIEMDANVNAYRPGRHVGTPLLHAAKRGLDQTVRLLLSHGDDLDGAGFNLIVVDPPWENRSASQKSMELGVKLLHPSYNRGCNMSSIIFGVLETMEVSRLMANYNLVPLLSTKVLPQPSPCFLSFATVTGGDNDEMLLILDILVNVNREGEDPLVPKHIMIK